MNFKNILHYVYTSILLLIVFTISIYIKHIELYKISNIEINGNNFISKMDIEKTIKKTIRKNSLLNLDIKSLQNNINRNPYISSSRVYAALPSKIIIEVKEISPIALFKKNNKIYFLDNKLNSIMVNSESLNYFSVPVITNKINNNYSVAGEILNIIKKHNKELYNKINEVSINDNEILLYISNNTKIKIKHKEEIRNTFKLLSFIDTIIENHKQISDYKYVDLTIPKQIIVKENNKI